MLCNLSELTGLNSWSDCRFNDEWTISGLFDWAGSRYSDRDAVWSEAQGWLKYGELKLRAGRVRQAILDRCPNDKLAIACLAPIDVPWFVGIQAIMTSGLAYVGLDPQAPPERNRMCLEDSGVGLILTTAELAPLAHEFKLSNCQVVVIEETQDSGPPASIKVVNPESVCAYVFTSGSTGRPKGVIRSHRSMARAVYCFSQMLGHNPTDTMLAPGSPGHIGALNDAVCGMITGYRSVPIDVAFLDLIRIRTLIAEHQVTKFPIAPSLLRLYLKTQEVSSPNHLRLILASGEALLRSDVRLFFDKLPNVQLWHNYGSTETGPMVGGRCQPNDADSDGPLPLQYQHYGCEVEIVDAQGCPLSSGEVGAIRIRSKYLANGYLNATPEQNARFGHDGRGCTFLTGDNGYLSERNELFVSGRGDRQIKLHGRRLELAEVEEAILKDQNWSSAAVVPVSNRDSNPTLVAVVQPAAGSIPDILALRSRLERALPTPAVPRRFVVVSEMPLTINRKIDFQAIEILAKQRSVVAAIGRGGPPEGLIENWIADTLQHILCIDRPGRDDRFQDLGGDSLAAMDFLVAMQRQFGLRLTLDQLVTAQSISQLVPHLRSDVSTQLQPVVKLRTDGTGPIFLMIPGIGGHAWVFASLARSLNGPCDILAVSIMDLLAERSGSAKSLIRETLAGQFVAMTGTRPIVLVGYSFGCLIAADLASSLQTNGVMVSQLILIDPSPVESKRLTQPLKLQVQNMISKVFKRRKSTMTVKGINNTVSKLNTALVSAYCDGSVSMPNIPVSMLSSVLMADRYKDKPSVFGKDISKIDRELTNLSHLELLRPPGVAVTAAWVEKKLAQINEQSIQLKPASDPNESSRPC